MSIPRLEQHYKTSELAERLNVNPVTILRAAARGELRSLRFGMERRYSESAVSDWMALLEARGDGRPGA